jgi:beta-lactamase regulating signal transducer with metallopeptidase domain
MLTFIWIAIVIILAIVAFFAYSTRTKKALPSQEITATDTARNPDRKRAVGRGED